MSGVQILHIIIPVYNEHENFENTYKQIQKHVHVPYDVTVVYDMEEDTTLPIVKNLQKKEKNLFLQKNIYGRGALFAVKTGLEVVSEGACLVVMADLSDDIAIVDKMFEEWKKGFAVVCGSRYMKGGKHIGGPKMKKILSAFAGKSLFHFIKIPTHDVTNNFKLYDKKMLQNITIESTGGFEIAMEITIKAFKKGYKITEIPSTWMDRTAGESKFLLWKWLPLYLKWYFYAIFSKKVS